MDKRTFFGKSFEIGAGPTSPQPWYAQLRRQLRVLRWAAPLSLLVLVVVYQLGPARWLEAQFGAQVATAAELLFYGTAGPALAWLIVEMLSRWLDERETSELQAGLLAAARETARAKELDSDTALQKLFAANLLLQSLPSGDDLLGAPISTQLRTAHQALEDALRHLSAGPSFPPE